MSAQSSLFGCRCVLVTVAARRWCVTPYAESGCGGHWALRNGRWSLQYSGSILKATSS